MLTFNEQSLVCFLQHSDKVPRHHLFFDVQDIKHVLSFERNPRGQIYVTQELESAIHGTLPTSFCINELYSKHLPTNVPVTYTHVGKDSNYFSKDNRFCVLNKGVESSDEIDIIQACQGLVITMFEDGHLADSFSYKEKKRASTPSSLAIDNINSSFDNKSSVISISSTSSVSTSTRLRNKKKRKQKRFRKSAKTRNAQSTHLDVLPTISLGWSTQNCHVYSKSKCSTAGNVKPCLRDGNLTYTSKELVLTCIKTVLKCLPVDACFNIDIETDEVVMNLRKEMMGLFQASLGGSSEYDSSFRIEGLTITIPSTIGFHRDSLNCNREGMQSVLSINVNVPINDNTVPQECKLRSWLDDNGFTDSFPVSLIAYSRKMNYHYASKVSRSVALSKQNDLFKLVDWMLRDRIGSVVDYHSCVWCNDNFAKEFQEVAKLKPSSRFKGKMTTTTETLDKIVSVLHQMQFYVSS